jgi:uncharacterized MAPEG superfamily protein
MTTPFWCLFIAAVLPYVLSSLGGYFRVRQLGTLDNKHPRIQKMQLEGIGARVFGAEQNAFEILPVFAAAVLVSHLAGADAARAAQLSEAFILTRILHPILYAANQDMLRSVVFLAGLGCCIALFVISA